MELILISDSKLKIMLTRDDLRLYSIDCDTLDYENTETRRAFWSILDEAKHRTGFDAASEKVFVQVYPSKAGGCEMYVTKLGALEESEQGDTEDDVIINPAPIKKRGENIIRKETYLTLNEKKRSIQRKREEIFKFDSLELLIKACRRLWGIGYSNESSAYIGDGACYLLLCGEDVIEWRGGVRPLVLEYSDKVDVGDFDMYIAEHGRCICENNAVRVLASF